MLEIAATIRRSDNASAIVWEHAVISDGVGVIVADENYEITEAIGQLPSQLTAVQVGSEDARLRFVVAEVSPMPFAL